jgi:Ca2+-binding RTX toxin-like protein
MSIVSRASVVKSFATIIGTPYADRLFGTTAGDAMAGGGGDDDIYGLRGNDTISGGAGNDLIDGGVGADMAVYSGNRADYTVTFNVIEQSYTIIDNRPGSPDGTDILNSIEIVHFADGYFPPSTLVNRAPSDIGLVGGTITENSVGGTVVGTLVGLDPDAGAVLTYSLANDANGRFIVDAKTGVIRVKAGAVLDFEATPTLTITARVTDQGGLSTDKGFVIVLANVNEAPTGLSLVGGQVAENSASGKVVGTLKGTDPDAGSVLTYALTYDAGGRFVVDAKTGVVSVKAGAVLDFEATPVLSIVARVTDQAGLSFDQALAVTLTNVNEAPTTLGFSGGTIKENSAGGTVVGTLKGTDPDAGAVLSYSLVDDSGGRFVVDAKTGVITVKSGAVLDFETTPTLNLTARVTDQGGLTYDKAFKVTLTNLPGLTNIGTAFSDTLFGSGEEDVISGLAGNDAFYSGTGNDTLLGGDGDDWLDGGAGADYLDGGAGINIVSYGDAQSRVEARLWTSTGTVGDAVGDVYVNIQNLYGSAYDDVLEGDANDNVLFGAAGNDTLRGGDGNDVLYGGGGADYLDGGTGINTAFYGDAQYGVEARLWTQNGAVGDAVGDVYVNIQNLYGSLYNDVLEGDANNNVLAGFAGNDTLNGGGGNDWLYGDDGSIPSHGGSDLFVYTSVGFGQDVIGDFNPEAGASHDRLSIASSLAGDFGTLLSKTQQTGSNLTITFSPTDSITLLGVALASFTADDVVFV